MVRGPPLTLVVPGREPRLVGQIEGTSGVEMIGQVDLEVVGLRETSMKEILSTGTTIGNKGGISRNGGRSVFLYPAL